MEYTGIDFSTYDTFVKTSGVEKNTNSLTWYTNAIENFKWTSRKELLEILGVSATALDNVMEQLKSNCHLKVFNEGSIKKGGYNNRETFYREDLVKLIQLQLMKNQTHKGHTSEVVTDTIDSSVKEKLADSKAEDIKLAELNLATEQTRLAAEKEISKQMRMLLKNENLKKDLDKLRTTAVGIAQYDKSNISKVYIGVNVGHPSDYKIGHASNMSRRDLIGTTDNPDLKYLYVKNVGSKSAAESLENTIHEELKDHNLQNYRPEIKSTEWFVLTPEELALIVRKYDFLPYELEKE